MVHKTELTNDFDFHKRNKNDDHIDTDIILGIAYNSVHPKVIRTLPSSLQIPRSKFFPAKTDEICCIVGPISAANAIAHNNGAQPTLH